MAINDIRNYNGGQKLRVNITVIPIQQLENIQRLAVRLGNQYK